MELATEDRETLDLLQGGSDELESTLARVLKAVKGPITRLSHWHGLSVVNRKSNQQ